MPQVTITIEVDGEVGRSVDASAAKADTNTDRRRASNASINADTIAPNQPAPDPRGTRMCDQSKGFCMGDLMPVIGAESAATQRIITSSLQMSLARLDVGAQKSMFEVDANEVGMTTAQYPRANGGAAPGN